MSTLCNKTYDQKIFRYGECGYWLYYELHTNQYNAIVHAIGMHAVVFGALLMVSALFKNNIRTSVPVIIYAAYIAYYMRFAVDASWTMIYFMPALLYAVHVLDKYNDQPLSLYGLAVMSTSILLQELIGHIMFEEAMSELEQIPNSISIAPLFASRSALKILQNCAI